MTSSQTIAALLALCPMPMATWYDYPHPRITADGERFDRGAFTAAHRTLPFGTLVQVSYKGRSLVVRITDRMPYHGCRVIDLTRGAARWLGMERKGVVPVTTGVVHAVPEYP